MSAHCVTEVSDLSRYRRGMDEDRQVRERLERIDRLRATGGSRAALLAEVRALLEEGERWLAAESQDGERPPSVLHACAGPPEREATRMPATG